MTHSARNSGQLAWLGTQCALASHKNTHSLSLSLSLSDSLSSLSLSSLRNPIESQGVTVDCSVDVYWKKREDQHPTSNAQRSAVLLKHSTLIDLTRPRLFCACTLRNMYWKSRRQFSVLTHLTNGCYLIENPKEISTDMTYTETNLNVKSECRQKTNM